MATIPDGAVCYFCLGEEADEEGKPLVRDCSCRGDSAGFAHLSCLTTYAEQKCKQANERDISEFTEPWEKCNNCKQNFQGQLSIDLVSSCVSFAETTYGHPDSSKWDKIKVIHSLRMQIVALAIHGNEVDKTERTMLINNILSIINQTKKDLNMSRWIHMPKASEEYKYYKMLCGNYEAYAHLQFATSLDLTEGIYATQEDENVAIGHLKKARAIYNLFGMKNEAQHMDTTIVLMFTTSKQATDASIATSSMLQNLKIEYEQSLNTHGINSEVTIHTGLHYAHMLECEHHLEAERLFTKVATASRQVHGPEHKTTLEANELLEKCKERFVWVFPEKKQFQALRYDNDGEICVVQGPITKPRKVDDERTHRVESNLIVPAYGCPVICYGLVSASHLNGELGVARDVKENETGIRLAVHFEKKGAKSALVKKENLRIAFELPDEKE